MYICRKQQLWLSCAQHGAAASGWSFILIHVVPVYYVTSAAMVAHIDFVSARTSHLCSACWINGSRYANAMLCSLHGHSDCYRSAGSVTHKQSTCKGYDYMGLLYDCLLNSPLDGNTSMSSLSFSKLYCCGGSVEFLIPLRPPMAMLVHPFSGISSCIYAASNSYGCPVHSMVQQHLDGLSS